MSIRQSENRIQFNITRVVMIAGFILFVILTLVLEIPIVYNLLKKHVDSKKKLLWSIVGSNIVTTAMVAVIERMVTDGYWA